MKILNLIMYIVNTLLIFLIIIILITTSNNMEDKQININLKKRMLATSFLNKYSVKQETNTETEVKNETETPINEVENNNEIEIINNIKPNESLPVVEEVQTEKLTGSMSGYGPDCKGCSGYLSSGMYVGDGNIYYEDKTFGKVRIVAGDAKYKLGTIVKITNSRVSTEPILAVVLDRGSAIGIDKKYMFDLLFESSSEAMKYQVSYNTNFEILRNGY